MESEVELEKNILRTLCWFSLFAYPLTSFELWKWMLREEGVWKGEYDIGAREYGFPKKNEKKKWKLEDVLQILEKSEFLKKYLEEKNGFFCLKKYGSISDHIKKRQAGFLDASRKIKKLRRVMWWFRLFPSVEAVAACNTLGWFLTNPRSDIDLFIVVRPGTIWTTRLFLVFPFMLLGKRPGQKKKDPFCFSFFLTSDALCFESFLLPGGDPYFAYWTVSLFPLFDRKHIFSSLLKQNSWTEDYLPQAFFRFEEEYFFEEHSVGQNFLQKRNKNYFESFAKWMQMRHFPQTLRDLANKDSRVVITDQTLKFHENDRRAYYREVWHKRCKEIL